VKEKGESKEEKIVKLGVLSAGGGGFNGLFREEEKRRTGKERKLKIAQDQTRERKRKHLYGKNGPGCRRGKKLQ